MRAPLTKHCRTHVEERCWKGEQGSRAKLENLSDQTQNCEPRADCCRRLEEEEEEGYPRIEMQAARCCQIMTLPQH